MGDEDIARGKRRNNQAVLLGIVGAVLGYVGGVTVAPFDRMDGITSAFVALFVIGPIGAVAGAFVGAKLAALILKRPPAADSAAAAPENAVTPTRNAFKSLGILLAFVVVAGGGYALYAYLTATPWLRPGNQYLLFEVRLPAGAPMPNPRDGVKVMLRQTVSTLLDSNINTMPADMERATFRQEGDRVVIAGEIGLAYRSSSRQVEVKIPGRAEQIYPLKLASSPRHMKQPSDWQKHSDGSEIRYRVKWPGEE